MIREFSAGGLVVRNMRGRRYVAVVLVKGGEMLALEDVGDDRPRRPDNGVGVGSSIRPVELWKSGFM